MQICCVGYDHDDNYPPPPPTRTDGAVLSGPKIR